MRNLKIGSLALRDFENMTIDGPTFLQYQTSLQSSQVPLSFRNIDCTHWLFPGDMMQYLTNSYLPSTPHKVGLNTRERYAFAYFHEPSFQAVINPLPEMHSGKTPGDGIHYGTHFTNMFMRNYPERVTSKRLIRENRQSLLDQDPLRTMAALNPAL